MNPGYLAGTQHFQCCTIGHSVTSPEILILGVIVNGYKITPVEQKAIAGAENSCLGVWLKVAMYGTNRTNVTYG